jgi:hypothetical protein
MDLFSTGLSSGSLLSAVSANATEVLANIAPIIEVIIGVALAFFVAHYLISLLKNTDDTGETGNIKSDLNMYHYSNKQMEHEGINPNGISTFDES